MSRRDAALLARAGEFGVPAEASRRRARAGYALLGAATLTGITLPALLQRFHAIRSGAPILAGGTTLVACLLLETLPWAWRTVTHGPDGRRLTGRTMTGLRTVDLGRLAGIRRVRIPGRGSWIDHLWITDRAGVSLWIDTPEHVERIAAAVRGAEPADAAGIRVSRFAAERLGLAGRRPRHRRVLRATADVIAGIYAPPLAAALGALAGHLIAAG